MAGPVKRGGVQVTQADDGRLIHSFRQSSLSELDLCPERGRLTLTGQMPRIETDAAALGTAAHYGFECGFEALADGRGPLDPDELYALMVQEFDRIAAMPNFEWKKYKRSKVLVLLDKIAHRFHSDIYADIVPLGIEIPFDHIVIYEDDERIIEIQGTIDLLDQNIGAADWKTAGDARKFARGKGGEAWKLDRWGVQPTVYIAALLAMGLLDPEQDEWPFTYFAFALSKDVELVQTTVTRHQGDIDWLADRCVAYARLVEAEVSPWPKQDNHALCSEAWCPAWSMCKGAHYAEGWPKPSLPSGVYTPSLALQ